MATIGIVGKVLDHLASSRFRVLIPAKHSKHKYKEGAGDITLITKFGVTPKDAKELAKTSAIVFDMCDDNFGDPRDAEFRELCKIADYITCTTETLADRIKEETGRIATVISDPLEFEQRAPKINGTQNLLWYGHHTNLGPVLDLKLGSRKLAIVTNYPGFIDWSLINMQRTLQWCDVVIIPVRDERRRSASKSPNRMTEAINAGRFVIANDMPAYRSYGMYIGDIIEGLDWLDSHQQQAMESLCKAQEVVKQRHDQKVISQEWDRLFDSILAAERSYGKASSM